MQVTRTTNIKKPRSLRRPTSALALGAAAAMLSLPVHAQEDAEDENGEVQLDTLQIEDYTADSNPYTQPGVPYKAQRSGDPRRVKPLAETPATITVLTEQAIEESGETDLRDILDNQPGVTVGTGENGNAFGDRYIIRGHEARSDVFVDGLRDPGMTTRESFAVEQIEITKGPSSSFAGRGSTGGAVNSITKRASTDYDFTKIDLGVGTDDYIRGTVDANFRLSDYAAVRANVLYAYEEVPDRNFSDRQRWGGALSASFAPTETLSILLDYYHLSADDRPDLGSYVPAPTGTGPGDVTVYDPWDEVPNYTQGEDFLESDVDTITGRITWEASPNLTLTNATRYGTTENGYVLTGLRGGAFSPATGTFAPLTLSTHQGNQEVDYFVNQFNALADLYTGDLYHQLIIGAEYSDLQVTNGTYALTADGATNCVTPGRNGPSPNYCITDENRNVLFDENSIHSIIQRDVTSGQIDSDWNVETWSLYLMDTVDITPWLSLHGGVRVDSFDYRNVLTSNAGVDTVYEYGDTLWNGHAGISVKPHEEVFVYFNWGTAKNINGGESDLGGSCGYGGICSDENSSIADGLPESSESLELGVKADLFDDRLLVTGALFQITKSDVFESAPGGEPSGPGDPGGNDYDPIGALNTGKNRVRGIELGLVGNITEQLMAQVSGTIMDSEILESNVPETIGRALSNFSEEQFFAQLRYQATPDFAVGTSATYKGEMFAGQPDSAASYNSMLEVYTFRVPDYWTFDAFATYRINPALQARVNVTNLSDEDYYLAAYRSGHFLYKGDERRATVTLTGRF